MLGETFQNVQELMDVLAAIEPDPLSDPQQLKLWRNTKSRKSLSTALDHQRIGVQVVGEGGAGPRERRVTGI
jgi:hypothetical protein